MFGKTHFLIAALSCAAVSLSAQREKIVPLQKSLTEARDDSTRWHYSLQLSAAYMRIHFDSARMYGEQSLAYSGDLAKGSCRAQTLNTLGAVYWSKGDHETALQHYFNSLKISEPGGLDNLASTTLGNIGLLYAERNDVARSLEYLHRALDMKIAQRDTLGMVRTLNNLGRTYLNNLNDLDSALLYFQRCLPLFDVLPDQQFGKGIVLNNIGAILIDKEDFEGARRYFQQSLQIREQLGDKGGLSVVLSNLGQLAMKEGKPAEAVGFLERSLALTHETGSGMDEIDVLKKLAEAYAAVKNYPKAYERLQEYTVMQDSAFTREREQSIADMEVQYQTERKEAEIARKQVQIQRQQLLLVAALALVLALAGVFQFFRNRLRRRRRDAEHALALEQAEAGKLRELDRVKSSFFANISHEFRTPLTLILGPVHQWLSRAGEAPVPVPPKDLRLIGRNAGRLLELVNQLLDLAKLENGRLRLSVAVGDLGQTLRVLAHSFESMAEQGEIRYEMQVSDEVKLAWFDRDKLEKILSNLLSNAFKNTPAGGLVRFEAGLRDGMLHFSVADTGRGIPTEALDRIFDRFYQVQNASETGTGIGLALVKELVSLHRGQIGVESAEGKGAVFQVALPVSRDAFSAEERSESPASTPETSGFPAWSRRMPATPAAPEPERSALPLCLVVEDNPELQTFIRDQLAGSFRVMVAANGREGLMTAIDQVPDLVVSDVMMPEMDGKQLCEALKTDERTSHVPVILLTARAGRESRIEGLETGADDYLTKPFDTHELLARARNLIAQRENLRRRFSRSVILKPQEIALTSADERFLERIQASLDKNLGNEQFGVEELAADTGMSRSQLHRKLTALIDQPPVEFIRNFRLRRAKEMLEAGTGNVSEVCYEVGFNSPAYFSKAFKDAFGLLPSEVLKN